MQLHSLIVSEPTGVVLKYRFSSPDGKRTGYQVLLDRNSWMNAIYTARLGGEFVCLSDGVLIRKEFVAERSKSGLICSVFLLSA